METKLTRPDLSQITQGAEGHYGYAEFYRLLKHEDKTVESAVASLPQLIQIAEMFFDANVHNPDSIAFQLVSKVLNDIKGE